MLTHTVNTIPDFVIIQPLTSVPIVKPKFPEEIPKLFANSLPTEAALLI
jgi:hypothetical protein